MSTEEDKKVVLEVEYDMTTSHDRALAFGFRAFVKRAKGIPREIFVYHRSSRVIATGFPWDLEIVDEFQNVATPVDIEETLPEGLANDNTRHFRSESVELLFRCESDMERARDAIDADVAALVRSWRVVGDADSYESSETKEYTNG
jgi:hypothetical protein